ncbi:hypothetical protein BDW67DRAFT_188855 [Aspergillus spinulosporus]
MTLQNWFDYIAIILLLTHVFLAFAHTNWSLWRGETSEAWDTIPELVALSQQSPPAPALLLDNTYAGARSMRTMGHIVCVCVCVCVCEVILEVSWRGCDGYAAFNVRESLEEGAKQWKWRLNRSSLLETGKT